MTDWSDVTVPLKDVLEIIRADDQRALQIKEVGDGKALDLQKETQQYKDEKANELREQISNERGAYLTRLEFNTSHQALIDKIDALTTRIAATEGRSGGLNQGWVWLLGAIVAIGTIIGIAVRLK